MAAIPEEIFFSTAVELNARLRAREFKAVELARAFLDRLRRFGPSYNALALLLEDHALRKAKAVDKELQRGRFRGPLQGVPYGAKDLLTLAGMPTTWGAKPYQKQVFDYTATVLRKLDGRGAVLAAKLALVELAGGGGYRYPGASLFGPGLNPWDRGRWSGGSSSGPGSAVAAGLVTFALGSETSGSILTPCAFCGITGLRPTYGLVSRAGAMALSWTMDKIGPMARSAEDCGHVLQAISGGDALDPSSASKSFYFTPQYAREPREVRFGYAPADFEESPDEPLRPPLKQALQAMRSLSGLWKEVELPALPYSATTAIVIGAEGSTAFAKLIASGAVDELADERQISGLKDGARITAQAYLQAMQVRRSVQHAFARLFSEMDVLVSPGRMTVASPVDVPLDRPSGAVGARTGRGLRALIPAGNLAGLPALALPCGFAGGLPVGLQLVGRPFSENQLLKIGMAFQQLTDWHRKRPPHP